MMGIVFLALLAHSLVGAFLAGFLDWQDDYFIVAVAPAMAAVLLIASPVFVCYELGERLRERMKGR